MTYQNFPRPHFILDLFIASKDETLLKYYTDAANTINCKADEYLAGNNNIIFDSGFDLYSPNNFEVPPSSISPYGTKIPMGIHCSMRRLGSSLAKNTDDGKLYFSDEYPCRNVGYYIYSRSSTPVKTPLRLANSVGIIDSGYTGEIITIFDNLDKCSYKVTKYQRLTQICPPDLSFPFKINILSSPPELHNNFRANKGLGSTGK